MCFHPFSRDEQRDPMGLMVRLHSSSYVRSRTDRQQAPFSQDHQKTITKEHRCCLLSTVSQRCLLSGEKKFRPILYFRQHLIFIVVRTNRKLANFYYVVNKVWPLTLKAYKDLGNFQINLKARFFLLPTKLSFSASACTALHSSTYI